MARPTQKPSTDRPVSAPANGTNGHKTAPTAGSRRNRTGMPWKRYFTKPGVAAFDEVEWETRAASITNEKGEVVFEQRDVEIPRGWSQVATNVVVSKYFRGGLGTPERERSVKQLIGRVARTIHQWGVAGGYFTTPESADIFREELTHLLVHQKAAFNSPVWFNVGIEEHPQSSACQPYHALVSTPAGVVPIGELVERHAVGEHVYDRDGITRIVAVKANGRKPVRRVVLTNGGFIEATPDHVVLAVPKRLQAPQWLPVELLEPGMSLLHDPDRGRATNSRQSAIAASQGGGGVGVLEPASATEERAALQEEEIVRIEDQGVQDVYDIQTESGNYLSNNIVVHNCFINKVEDTMGSILTLAKTEGMLFKYGSGTGTNLSPIRSSRELLAGGGTASGPVSFMKGYDAFAGVIKSGGKTRRAAKMVILNADHPDIVEFINCKVEEERKAWTLIEAGYDPSFNGPAYSSIFFQNSNNSVRVTDDFMHAVEQDLDWHTRAVTNGRIMDTYKARDLMRMMAEAAWACGDPGLQYDTTVNHWHTSANTDRINASNPCSEYMFLDNTSCNLASINLMTFLDDRGEFDVEGYREAIRILITAQEIIVDNASYPTEAITKNSRDFRPLGLGYANLGALLMASGLPYDSDAGRDVAAALTAVLTGEAYAQSARIAARKGPFAGFAVNREPMLRVMDQHRDAIGHINPAHVPLQVLAAARESWDTACELGAAHGYRNAQATVIAPTGTIGFMMDCDTTGIEPDIALVKYKKLVGGGMLKIVNQTVPIALRRLGYSEPQVSEILQYIDEQDTIEGAPHLRPDDLPVFDCAFKPAKGSRSIHYMGHVKMMASAQPFISGAISKTVNMPEQATADDIMEVYMEGWRMGLKAIAIYRDNSKRSQPLNTALDTKKEKVAAVAPTSVETPRAVRRKLQDERRSITHKFDIQGHEGYITVGTYPDGRPGEIFLVMSKEGSTISGLMDAFATSISLALQYGVPLEVLVKKFAHTRFEPSGFTKNPEIPIAKSITDYIFRWLASKFLNKDQQDEVGLVRRDTAPLELLEAPAPSTASRPATIESGQPRIAFQGQEDAPACSDCGSIMVRNGTCYKCLNCGSTSGCS
jgi:ribonucleoside-diphosphate reductase alpha chain